MRLEKEIKEFGYFTLGEPCGHIDKIPGFLSVDIEGNTCIDLYDIPRHIYSNNELYTVKTIHGNLQNGQQIIAIDPICLSCNVSFPGGISCHFSVNFLLTSRGSFEAPKTFNAAMIKIDGLREWYGPTEELIKICNGQNKVLPKPIILYDGDDMALELHFEIRETHNVFASPHREIDVFLRLIFKESLGLEEIVSDINKIVSFFLFSMDKRINMFLPIKLYKDKSCSFEEEAQLYYKNKWFSNDSEKTCFYPEFIRYQDIRTKSNKCFVSWLDVHKIMSISLWQYFDYKIKIAEEVLEINTLIYAIEALHRTQINNSTCFKPSEFNGIKKGLKTYLFSTYNDLKAELIYKKLDLRNTMSLSERMYELLNRNCNPNSVVDETTKKKIVEDIVSIRNTISHGQISRKKKNLKSYEAADVQIKIADLLELIYKIEMLRILSIKEEKVHEIIARRNINLKTLSMEDF